MDLHVCIDGQRSTRWTMSRQKDATSGLVASQGSRPTRPAVHPQWARARRQTSTDRRAREQKRVAGPDGTASPHLNLRPAAPRAIRRWPQDRWQPGTTRHHATVVAPWRRAAARTSIRCARSLAIRGCARPVCDQQESQTGPARHPPLRAAAPRSRPTATHPPLVPCDRRLRRASARSECRSGSGGLPRGSDGSGSQLSCEAYTGNGIGDVPSVRSTTAAPGRRRSLISQASAKLRADRAHPVAPSFGRGTPTTRSGSSTGRAPRRGSCTPCDRMTSRSTTASPKNLARPHPNSSPVQKNCGRVIKHPPTEGIVR